MKESNMTTEQDGAAQVARLNDLLARLADTLVKQDARIDALEKAMAAAYELLQRHGAVLHGHQAVLTHNRLDGPIPQSPGPARLN